jgi:hypothetical protein
MSLLGLAAGRASPSVHSNNSLSPYSSHRARNFSCGKNSTNPESSSPRNHASSCGCNGARCFDLRRLVAIRAACCCLLRAGAVSLVVWCSHAEPPVVIQDSRGANSYLLLDGHLRIEVLRDLGQTEVECLVSTDDEAFTYNKRISRLSPVGVGRVLHVTPAQEYRYTTKDLDEKLRSMMWELMIQHSIRPGFKDGFVFPYHAAIEKAANDSTFDPADLAAMVPQDRFSEFSYASELVTHDGAIGALLASAESLL